MLPFGGEETWNEFAFLQEGWVSKRIDVRFV